ncbi:DUF3515 domain-containing protein [Williamsia sp. Leaf354]|uniref:DUF3515 domain-containing protein n=1 Tax=Williamsia sp. Leaf354 TaxID=1736349 RepID=UPI000ACA29B8|nr:DUF3515 domain-containing protein [Williamsia sp. Leaf354]
MSDSTGRRSPALIATLVTIPVMVIVLFIAIAAFRTDSSGDSLPLASAAAPQSAEPDCAKLIAALPATFAGFDDRSESGGLVQWQPTGDAAGPVQLRCGVDRPTDLAPTSALQVVDPVQWFATGSGDPDATGTLWVAVDHRPYVALWLPSNSGNGPIADTSRILDRILPRASIDLGS